MTGDMTLLMTQRNEERDLADRLADVLRSRLAYGYLPGDEGAREVLSDWEEARRD